MIPSSCMVFYDRCNTCGRALDEKSNIIPNSKGFCTKKGCPDSRYQKPRCKKYY